MSVWSNVVSPVLPLSGPEGALVSVSVCVEPSRLESLLDALASLEFPINPQIFHDSGHAARPAAVVEFPAYENRLPEIRNMLNACGFPPDSMEATAMLECIRAGHTARAVA